MGDPPTGITRRRALTLFGGAMVLSGAALLARPDESTRPDGHAGATRYEYGDDPSQFGDLYLPRGRRRLGTMLLLHGGFWRAAYGVELAAPIAADLAQRGWTVWNLEYRRLGNGGGWPDTFADVAAGTDHLRTMADRGIDIDLRHVIAIGHSAGGQLAAWLAARPSFVRPQPGAEPRVEISAVVSQAGILDLGLAARSGLGDSIVPRLMGGTPDERPWRYASTDPVEQVPVRTPVRCIHSRADTSVPYQQSTSYVAAARAAGGDARLVEVQGNHFALINPSSRAWSTTIDLLPKLTQP